MTVNQKPTGRASAIPAGLAWGAMVSVIITLAGCLVGAKLINEEILSWDHTGYCVMVILLLASWAGAMTAAGKIKRRRLGICALSGLLYFGVLLMTAALFFGGRYSGAGETGLLIFCGSMLGFFSGFQGKSRRNAIKKRTYHG